LTRANPASSPACLAGPTPLPPPVRNEHRALRGLPFDLSCRLTSPRISGNSPLSFTISPGLPVPSVPFTWRWCPRPKDACSRIRSHRDSQNRQNRGPVDSPLKRDPCHWQVAESAQRTAGIKSPATVMAVLTPGLGRRESCASGPRAGGEQGALAGASKALEGGDTLLARTKPNWSHLYPTMGALSLHPIFTPCADETDRQSCASREALPGSCIQTAGSCGKPKMGNIPEIADCRILVCEPDGGRFAAYVTYGW
jgi:hypothetical protein